MKKLSFVNSKSAYALASEAHAEAEETILDPSERLDKKIKCLDISCKLKIIALKERQQDQIDAINDIKTTYRNPELKNFDPSPIEMSHEEKLKERQRLLDQINFSLGLPPIKAE